MSHEDGHKRTIFSDGQEDKRKEMAHSLTDLGSLQNADTVLYWCSAIVVVLNGDNRDKTEKRYKKIQVYKDKKEI